ncbi:aminoacyl--tRNA ligase-related protein [Micromonospora qiuiae]|uniref:aminoacyl--tRNA ligase-related protein n=1 Tax=Micromonospora qiuiae TaxID=502268 RepID=UPI003557344C
MSAPLSDQSARPARVVVPAHHPVAGAVAEAELPTEGPEAAVVVRDAQGVLRDLAWAPDVAAEVEPVVAHTDDGRAVLRHSAAHVLALPHPPTEDDLALLEKQMRQIDGAGQTFARRTLDSVDAARQELAGEPYKLRLLDLRAAGRRDHRRLGPELDLFSFPDEVGAGLAVFHPRGGVVRREIEAHARRRHQQAGYDFVYMPHLTRAELIQICGPLEWYRDYMYPVMRFDLNVDEHGTAAPGDFYLKPMNCPLHNVIYRSRSRSHQELPLRMFEIRTIYRYEPGPMHGLTATGGMTNDDSHVFCTPEQLRDELAGLLAFVLSMLRDYGLTDLHLEMTTRNDAQYLGTDEQWATATDALRAAAASTPLPLVLNPGRAEFYGPRIAVWATDSRSRPWKLSTLQVDFNLPERFALAYTAPDGSRQRPQMIHCALFGSVERFFGILTEHYAGAFPAWLAPVQVACIPTAAGAVGHVRQVADALRAAEVRVDLDLSDGDPAARVDAHFAQLVPFLVLAGDGEQAAGTVSVRFRDGGQLDGVPAAAAVEAIGSWIARRDNAEPTAAAFSVAA